LYVFRPSYLLGRAMRTSDDLSSHIVCLGKSCSSFFVGTLFSTPQFCLFCICHAHALSDLQFGGIPQNKKAQQVLKTSSVCVVSDLLRHLRHSEKVPLDGQNPKARRLGTRPTDFTLKETTLDTIEDNPLDFKNEGDLVKFYKRSLVDSPAISKRC
jgi:hypothetical protein